RSAIREERVICDATSRSDWIWLLGCGPMGRAVWAWRPAGGSGTARERLSSQGSYMEGSRCVKAIESAPFAKSVHVAVVGILMA
ncbi:unnamed protein product, partial [Mycena citricolor]